MPDSYSVRVQLNAVFLQHTRKAFLQVLTSNIV